MNTQERSKFYKDAVYAHADLMYAALEQLWENPETGFREVKTHAYLLEQYRKLGYEPVEFGDIPGFYCDIETGKPGPKLLFMGEMDALIVGTHPACDKATGMVHACGHNAQSAALLGLAAALKTPGILDGLCGSIRLMAVPAEEMIETDFRRELQKEGRIRYLGGKPELIYRGYMDGCDMAVVVHTLTMDQRGIHLSQGSNGCIVKAMRYTGRASHAGNLPNKGINALYAATLGMNAVNALRETFPDREHVRFHPIITEGGDSVSAIPSHVAMESFVRGASVETMKHFNRKINIALAAGAAAMGAGLEIEDLCGSLPLHTDDELRKVTREVVIEEMGEDQLVETDFWSGGCTDLGDVSAIMPCIQPYASGAVGIGHGSDYYIARPEEATCQSAHLQLGMIRKLLENGAERANCVIRNSKPAFASREEYLAYRDGITRTYHAVEYCDNGNVELHLS